MPKRKTTRSLEEDLSHYKNKIKKLERKIRDRQKSESSPEQEVTPQDEVTQADTPALRPDDWLLDWPEQEPQPDGTEDPQATISAVTAPPALEPGDTNETALDTEILEILGDDPSNTRKYGPEIRAELANRLLHIIKEGLDRENRKNLISKYLLPINCAHMDAPKINPEIKAALTDAAIKRDKGIETKQKQMASALASLTELLNSQIRSENKDTGLLQKLMDITRILCDLQHADSITRRNFIMFALKEDIKDHLKNTKTDTLLFGENLPDTLRSAKVVNKSSMDLKVASVGYRGTTSKPLNRKAPPQARRPPAGPARPPPPPAPRSREPAASRAQYPPPTTHHQPPHAHTSRPSSRGHPRRRY